MLYLTDTGLISIPRNGVKVTDTFDIVLKRYAGSELTFLNLIPFLFADKYIQFSLSTSQLTDGQWTLNLFVNEVLHYQEDVLIKLPQKGIDFETTDIVFGFEAPTFAPETVAKTLTFNNKILVLNNKSLCYEFE